LFLEDAGQQPGVSVVLLFGSERGGGRRIGFVGIPEIPFAELVHVDHVTAGLDTGEALPAEPGPSHVLDQEGFFGADGLVLDFEGGEESEERGALILEDGGVADQEVAAVRVERGASRAFGGAWAGGSRGVQGIGLELIVA
jgi:hypothetical protein